MLSLFFATCLVISLTLSGIGAIAYLFPDDRTQD